MSASPVTEEALDRLDFEPACTIERPEPCDAAATHAVLCGNCGVLDLLCTEHTRGTVRKLATIRYAGRAIRCESCGGCEHGGLKLITIEPLPGQNGGVR